MNTQNTFGCTALMMACEKGYSDVISLLIKQSASDKRHTEIIDVNIQDILMDVQNYFTLTGMDMMKQLYCWLSIQPI